MNISEECASRDGTASGSCANGYGVCCLSKYIKGIYKKGPIKVNPNQGGLFGPSKEWGEKLNQPNRLFELCLPIFGPNQFKHGIK